MLMSACLTNRHMALSVKYLLPLRAIGIAYGALPSVPDDAWLDHRERQPVAAEVFSAASGSGKG
jgi:hypothetical protein